MLKQIDLSRVDLNLLVLFEAVFQEKHVGRTAGRLSLSPSAVSHGLGRLRRLFNDPLFLRTPKGVLPSARALELAPAIADVLERTRVVLATAEPFDPEASARAFTIGAPDALAAVFLPQLIGSLRRSAPMIDLRLRQLLPAADSVDPDAAWAGAFGEVETRLIDVAILPAGRAPLRFESRTMLQEDFVLVRKRGGRGKLDLDRYCGLQHLVVSTSGDPRGIVDVALAELGRSRRVALTVPNFMLALAVVAETDLVAALPRRLVAAHAARFDLAVEECPVPLQSFSINAVTSRAAMLDAGVAWLMDRIAEAC